MILSQTHSNDPATGECNKTILIVDDEAIIRDLCSRALKGYSVLEACDGTDALSLFEQGGVDVILTDVMMPKMNGLDLLKKVKEIDPTSVVIIMTGFAEKDIILNALKDDADDFIAKPLNLLQLKTAVDKALVKKELKEELASLKNLDRLKTNFLSLISHKFRTPITAISLFLQNLATGLFDPEDEIYKQNVKMIYNEACYLERMIAELLTFSRVMVNGESLRLERCDLSTLIMQSIAESKEVLSKSGLQSVLDIDPLPPISADREKLGFAIRQIIENAYKFSGDTGQVSISLKSSEDRAVLQVRDTGAGISREELPKIFEKFYQVDPANTGQVRGFGLGLYYSREFVRLHGGTISIESEAGKGSCATIVLPMQELEIPA
ncbi:sensor protein SrrB [Geobacter sp. OR-1]|uniref:hybrid sensor histidine kinase/response regulator n=1 Tax=Geobacter sp. OR-1 TaxID=1266765 RepID=UPI00054318B5|nr:hybrid sensor histidine kinase/response regulator [Geobacter sp. OR-1]GAM08695.1 sensor protein SrrB [Geobacter sp. OR-1]